jgi:CHAD domain-containing protein
VTGALQQALPNAAEIASGTAQPEHLHQLRTALRRLRSVLRVYAPLANDPAAALALEDDWRGPFGQLGAARDDDVVRQTLLPLIEQARQAAGASDLPPVPRDEGPAPQEVVRGAAFTALMLRTLALCLPASEPSDQVAIGPVDLVILARAQIKPLWRQVLRGAKTFSDADPQARHRLRKRLKRLRMALSVLQPLLKPKPTSVLQRRLGRALARLGELNDLEVAEQRFRQAAVQDPSAWFAVGYLSACRQHALKPASRALERLAKARIDWRDGPGLRS